MQEITIKKPYDRNFGVEIIIEEILESQESKWITTKHLYMILISKGIKIDLAFFDFTLNKLVEEYVQHTYISIVRDISRNRMMYVNYYPE